MKTNVERRGNTSSQISAMKIVIGCCFVSGVVGCTQSFKFTPRPELASRPYTLKEEVWLKVIRENYPQWNQPYLMVESNDGNANGNGNLEHTAAPQNLHGQPHSPPARPLSRDEVMIPNSRSTTRVHSSPSEYGGEDRLPAAIIDRANTKVSPIVHQSFKIIPEDLLPHDDRISGNSGLRRYTVLKGESLMVIARKLYDDESVWKQIYYLNRDVLEDPNNIRPGITLVIP